MSKVLSSLFEAERSNGRGYATELRPSVVCNVRIVAKLCILRKNLSAEANRKWPMENRRSHDPKRSKS